VCSPGRTHSKVGSSSPGAPANWGLNAPRIHAQVGMNAAPESSSGYQNMVQNPYGLLPVRRKRKRLTSNGSIESDAAFGHRRHPKCISPRHFR